MTYYTISSSGARHEPEAFKLRATMSLRSDLNRRLAQDVAFNNIVHNSFFVRDCNFVTMRVELPPGMLSNAPFCNGLLLSMNCLTRGASFVLSAVAASRIITAYGRMLAGSLMTHSKVPSIPMTSSSLHRAKGRSGRRIASGFTRHIRAKYTVRPAMVQAGPFTEPS